MRLGTRDVFATGAVAIAGLLYGLWASGTAPWGMSSVRVTGVTVLVLGFVASACAVVPTFDQLVRGNRVYLLIASLIGSAALAGGVWTLVAATEFGLGLLIGATGVLWVISTAHHMLLARAAVGESTVSVVPAAEKREAA